jgi:replicative DNA helicase
LMKIENLILSSLIHNTEYARAVLPFVKDEYFRDQSERNVFNIINEFYKNYNAAPNTDALVIELQNSNLKENEYKEQYGLVQELKPSDVQADWLLVETEKFCKDRAVYNAILASIGIIDGKDKNHSQDSIPTILQEALAVGFDNRVGHDYIEDAADRFDFYHKVENRIPFDLDLFNKITNGGLPNKTLNVVLAGTGVGKSLFMCHVAASALSQNKNVLYITLEMAEERIAERIDANLMNITLDDLKDLPRPIFESRVAKLNETIAGKLIIKEYPTAGAHAGHFRNLLKELQLKRDIRPDIIIIDYLNICASSRFKAGANINSYTLVKSIAEELRGLAVEYDVPILSATQTTRGGYGNTEVELTDTSESFGLPATVDFMFALISTEDLEAMNQLMVKQLKNRYNDPTVNKKFVIGVDRAKMRLYDLEAGAQRNLNNAGIKLNSDALEVPGVKKSTFNKLRDFSSIKI